MDTGWLFHQGDLPISPTAPLPLSGSPAECMELREGKWSPLPAFAPGHDWVEVDLPHDFVVGGNFLHEDRLCSHGYLPAGVGWYRREFSLPGTDRGRKILLEFDGVYRNSTVWVNGHRLGTHLSGYTSFAYDLTDVARYGDEGGNVILVRADASEFEGWWYEGGGIYRHVWLVKTDRLHVAQWGVQITTPAVSAEKAEVRIGTTVRNEHAQAAAFELVTTILDGAGREVAAVRSAHNLEHDIETEILQRTIVHKPLLWSVDEPNLYSALTEVRVGGAVVDSCETTFGIRTIEFTRDHGFFLNGKPLPIKGICMHQDFAGVGVALPDSLIAYKLRLLKEMGCNAVRSAHHPPTPELLDLCDRMGLMVMDENRHLDSSRDGLDDLARMIRRDRNHPCIILWSLENEEHLEGTEMGARILETLARAARRMDPTRPVTAAMNKGHGSGGYADVLDVVGHNYGHNRGRDVADHEAHPGRKILGSENASCTTTRGIYERDDARGHCPADGSYIEDWGCTGERAWQDFMAHPFLTGVFIWTGFDYRGEPTPYRWPCINSHFGLMDTCGFPKDQYHYFRSVWTDEPMVHIFPHWNRPCPEGELVTVRAYSNCETVELYLNGQSLGEKPMPPGGHLAWEVAYVPGELKAVGRRDGREAASMVAATTGAPAGVRLDADRGVLVADGCDTAVVRVAILDERGRVVPTADDEVLFTLEGPGRIIGVGNGNPSSHEPDKSNRRRAFNGYCLVIIQAGGEPGRLVLHGRAPGLTPASVAIDLVPGNGIDTEWPLRRGAATFRRGG